MWGPTEASKIVVWDALLKCRSQTSARWRGLPSGTWITITRFITIAMIITTGVILTTITDTVTDTIYHYDKNYDYNYNDYYYY